MSVEQRGEDEESHLSVQENEGHPVMSVEQRGEDEEPLLGDQEAARNRRRWAYNVRNRRWEEHMAVYSPTVDLLASLLDNASSTASSEKVCIHTIHPLT